MKPETRALYYGDCLDWMRAEGADVVDGEPGDGRAGQRNRVGEGKISC